MTCKHENALNPTLDKLLQATVQSITAQLPGVRFQNQTGNVEGIVGISGTSTQIVRPCLQNNDRTSNIINCKS